MDCLLHGLIWPIAAPIGVECRLQIFIDPARNFRFHQRKKGIAVLEPHAVGEDPVRRQFGQVHVDRDRAPAGHDATVDEVEVGLEVVLDGLARFVLGSEAHAGPRRSGLGEA